SKTGERSGAMSNMNSEPTVTVSKPAASPGTSSSRLPASSSSRATVERSPPPSEHIAAVPVTEERNPKKPILLLVAGLAVVGFMVVLIIGTVILQVSQAWWLATVKTKKAIQPLTTQRTQALRLAMKTSLRQNFLKVLVAAVTGMIDVSVVRVEVSNSAESLSTEGETSHVASTHAAQNVELAELTATPGATTDQ
ncbi:hypothetical protein MTO96_024679, partial [Rhipicephalus appendiculatus]